MHFVQNNWQEIFTECEKTNGQAWPSWEQAFILELLPNLNNMFQLLINESIFLYLPTPNQKDLNQTKISQEKKITSQYH